MLFPGERIQPLRRITTSQLKCSRLSQEVEMEMVSPFRDISTVNKTKNAFSVTKIQKAIEKRKITNKVPISTKPQTWKSGAESLTLLISHFRYSGQLETRQHCVPPSPFRATSFAGILFPCDPTRLSTLVIEYIFH